MVTTHTHVPPPQNSRGITDAHSFVELFVVVDNTEVSLARLRQLPSLAGADACPLPL